MGVRSLRFVFQTPNKLPFFGGEKIMEYGLRLLGLTGERPALAWLVWPVMAWYDLADPAWSGPHVDCDFRMKTAGCPSSLFQQQALGLLVVLIWKQGVVLFDFRMSKLSHKHAYYYPS